MKSGSPQQNPSPVSTRSIASVRLQGLLDDLGLIHRSVFTSTGVHETAVCLTCHTEDGTPELWPCPTLRIARRALRVAR